MGAMRGKYGGGGLPTSQPCYTEAGSSHPLAQLRICKPPSTPCLHTISLLSSREKRNSSQYFVPVATGTAISIQTEAEKPDPG